MEPVPYSYTKAVRRYFHRSLGIQCVLRLILNRRTFFFDLLLISLSLRGPRDITVKPFAVGHNRVKQRGAFYAAIL